MNVGDYVRTEKGILKIRDDKPFKDDKNKLNYLTYGNYTCVLKENIIKSSSNIIDLIEVGDYVNGLKITSINEPSMANCNKRLLYAEDEEGYLIKKFDKEDIKSIVTKEQFESMEYKVGE